MQGPDDAPALRRYAGLSAGKALLVLGVALMILANVQLWRIADRGATSTPTVNSARQTTSNPSSATVPPLPSVGSGISNRALENALNSTNATLSGSLGSITQRFGALTPMFQALLVDTKGLASISGQLGGVSASLGQLHGISRTMSGLLHNTAGLAGIDPQLVRLTTMFQALRHDLSKLVPSLVPYLTPLGDLTKMFGQTNQLLQQMAGDLGQLTHCIVLVICPK